nr:hypothetical protein [Acinetobacter junii]
MDLTQLASTKMAKSEVEMTTLRIESIFSNFSFYKQNYLNIINDPSQYYQVVESANIHFASFSDERLYLGDLLQLWLSDKWTEHQLKTLTKSHYLLPTQDGVNGQNSLFLFAFKKHSLFKQAYAYAWNTLENKVQEIALNESFPFYCHYLTLSRPKRV